MTVCLFRRFHQITSSVSVTSVDNVGLSRPCCVCNTSYMPSARTVCCHWSVMGLSRSVWVIYRVCVDRNMVPSRKNHAYHTFPMSNTICDTLAAVLISRQLQDRHSCKIKPHFSWTRSNPNIVSSGVHSHSQETNLTSPGTEVYNYRINIYM